MVTFRIKKKYATDNFGNIILDYYHEGVRMRKNTGVWIDDINLNWDGEKVIGLVKEKTSQINMILDLYHECANRAYRELTLEKVLITEEVLSDRFKLLL